MADLVGDSAAEDGKYAPRETEGADHVAPVLDVEPEIRRHTKRQQRSDDPTVEPYEPEPDAEQCNRSPLVSSIPGSRSGRAAGVRALH